MAELVQSATVAMPQIQGDDAVALFCHKLRTPLTAAMGFIQLALREAEGQSGNEDQLGMLEMVDQQLRRMSSMINELAEKVNA